MKKLWIVIIPMFFAFLFWGCSGKHALKKEMAVQPIQLNIVTQCVPKVVPKVYHNRGEMAAIATGVGMSMISTIGGVIGGAISDTSVKKWEAAVEKELFAAKLPRFHELVMEEIVEKIGREIPNWHPVIVDDQGVDPGTVKSLQKKGPLLVLACGSSFSVPPNSCAPGLSTGHGLESKYRALLYDKDGNMVWDKKIEYASDHEKGRYRKIKEYSENNWQLLREEMDFAAKTIAERLVDDLMREIRKAD